MSDGLIRLFGRRAKDHAYMEDTCTLPKLIAFIPAANHILDRRIERRFRKTYYSVSVSPRHAMTRIDAPTRKRTARRVSKFFAVARTMVRMLQMTSRAGI